MYKGVTSYINCALRQQLMFVVGVAVSGLYGLVQTLFQLVFGQESFYYLVVVCAHAFELSEKAHKKVRENPLVRGVAKAPPGIAQGR